MSDPLATPHCPAPPRSSEAAEPLPRAAGAGRVVVAHIVTGRVAAGACPQPAGGAGVRGTGMVPGWCRDGATAPHRVPSLFQPRVPAGGGRRSRPRGATGRDVGTSTPRGPPHLPPTRDPSLLNPDFQPQPPPLPFGTPIPAISCSTWDPQPTSLPPGNSDTPPLLPGTPARVP